MLGLPIRYWLRNPGICAQDLLSDPFDLWTLAKDNFIADRERRRPPCGYVSNPDWERRLHTSLGIPWPCDAASEFWDLWPNIMRELEERGIRPGPESFLSWNDGDAGFTRALWCIVRHLKPRKIVETGVAHGVTSRFLLEALERNGDGHLWSIDFPPYERHLRKEIGAAVGGRYSDRWTYIQGSSRRRLPKLLSSVEGIDLFIHDSMHSERNVRFELDLAWDALNPNGITIVDDVDANYGFRSFTEAFSVGESLICDAEPLRPDLRRFNQKGLFGVILKKPSSHASV